MWGNGAVWDPFRPQQVIQGWGEGFDNNVYQDNFGRTYTLVDDPIGGEGAQTFAQTEGYSGIWGEGNPMPGELAPIYQPETKPSTRLGDMMPTDFYTGNLSADTLNYMVPYGSEWGRAMAMAGAPVESYVGQDVYNKNDGSHTNTYYSTLKGDYSPGMWGKDGQDFGFIRYETDSIWGADPKITRDVLINKIAPALGASYEEVARAAQQAQGNFAGTYGQGYTEASSPLDIIQNTYNILAQNKGIQPQALFDEATLNQSRADAQARQDMLKQQDEEQSGFLYDAMQIMSSPGFGMLVGFGAPMISSWASAMSGAAGAAGAGAAGAADPFFAQELAGLSFAEAGAGGLPGTVDALATGASIASHVSPSAWGNSMDVFNSLSDAGLGYQDALGEAIEVGRWTDAVGAVDKSGDIVGRGGELTVDIANPGSASLFDLVNARPKWLDQAAKFAFDAFSAGNETTLDGGGYVPEVGDDSGGITQTDAIFRSAKDRKGVPGAGFTTFQIGSPGLFIP